MKRKILILLSISLMIIAAGGLTPWVIRYSRDQVVVLGGIILLTGLLFSNLIILGIFKLIHVDRRGFSKPNRWALNLFIVFAGIVLAGILNAIAAKPLAKLFFAEVNRGVFFTLNEIIVLAGFLLLLVNLFYILLRLYEETLAKRAKRFSRQSFLQGGWKLVVKLLLGGLTVFAVTLSISSSAWVQQAEYFFDRTADQYNWHEKNDSIGVVFIYTEGKSHEWYFNTVYQVCSGLRDAGAKAVLIPLPPQLQPVQSNIKSLERISMLGIVVFAISPEEKGKYPDLWVRHPANNKINIEWGVISAETLPELTWWSVRYYPMSFKETEQGYRVPDAALRVVQKFIGEGKEQAMTIEGRRLTVGRFQTGLNADQSVPIFNRIDPWEWAYSKVTVSGIENSNSLEYYRGDVRTERILKSNALSEYKGKIVLIEPGKTITSVVQFANTYSQIIHQILRGHSMMPLDRWTSSLIAVFIFVAAGLFWLYRPWVASLGLIFLTVGQGFLYSWMNSRYGLIIEAVPLFITGALSIPMFVFVRINHERSFLHVVEKQRALQELQTAHDMQMGLMPEEDPIVPGFDISGICLPANDVGGDFFDYVWLDGKRRKLGIAVADVSGKAMKAAITAVMTSGMIYREAGGNQSPKTILRNMNRPMYTKLDSRMFTALSFAVIDTRKKELRFSNAGQSYPLLKRGKEVRLLEVKGARLPLGVKEDVTYGEMAVKLRKGDTLIFYTDGIPEAKDEKDEFYGFERLKSLMENLGGLLAKEMRDRILSEVKSFTGNAPQHDDMTVVVVKVN